MRQALPRFGVIRLCCAPHTKDLCHCVPRTRTAGLWAHAENKQKKRKEQKKKEKKKEGARAPQALSNGKNTCCAVIHTAETACKKRGGCQHVGV